MIRPLALLFPPIHSPEDARRLVRRCWGGWFLLFWLVASALLLLMMVVMARIVPEAAEAADQMRPWKNLAYLGPALIVVLFLCLRLFSRAALWAAWLLLFGGLLHLIWIARRAALYEALLWFWPAIYLFAIASLINAIRGCRGLRHYNRPEVIAAPFRDDGPSPTS